MISSYGVTNTWNHFTDLQYRYMNNKQRYVDMTELTLCRQLIFFTFNFVFLRCALFFETLTTGICPLCPHPMGLFTWDVYTNVRIYFCESWHLLLIDSNHAVYFNQTVSGRQSEFVYNWRWRVHFLICRVRNRTRRSPGFVVVRIIVFWKCLH